MREMGIGENYEINITPIRSDTSRFSGGTDIFLSALRAEEFGLVFSARGTAFRLVPKVPCRVRVWLA